MGQSTIIMVIGVAIALTFVIVNSNERVKETTDKNVNYYAKNVAVNICNSATEMLLSEVADDKSFRVSNLTQKSMMGGIVDYKLTDTTIDGNNKIKISVLAEYNGETAANILVASPSFEGFVPVGLKAAISTFNDVRTLGNLTVDGRDHDLNGKVINNAVGVYSVWSTGKVSQDGSSRYGGYANDKDYQPTPLFNSKITKQNQSFPSDYTNTPDGVLGGASVGFPEGTLKYIAKNGKEGSQYVTDPNNLNMPLSGVTYVELSSGSKWNNPTLQGSGVLIVHNSSTNAMIDNMKGNFNGLLISDHIDQIHSNIIGGVIGLAKDNTFGPAIGLGSGNVLYSSEAIKIATKQTGKGQIIQDNFRLTIDYWLDK